jgi:hypothetical protein
MPSLSLPVGPSPAHAPYVVRVLLPAAATLDAAALLETARRVEPALSLANGAFETS